MAVNYAGELSALPLEERSLAEQVVILGDQDSAKGRCSLQEKVVA
jgi:hypothetical protein